MTSPAASDVVHPADELLLAGEASASDVGLIPDDSLWWTVNGVEVGRGRVVRRRVGEGAQVIALHARYGARSGSQEVRLTTQGEGVGRVLWTASLTTTGSSALSLGPGGVLYALERTTTSEFTALVAVGTDGSMRWRTSLGTWIDASFPVVGPDGTVYVGTMGGGDNQGSVLAISPDGARKWAFLPEAHGPPGSTYYEMHGSPAVGSDGTIYVGTEENDRPIYAINPDGSLRWRTSTTPSRTCSSCNRFMGPVTIVSDSLVVGVRRGGSLVAVAAATGQERWQVQVPAINAADFSTLHNPVAVGADGDIYSQVFNTFVRIRPNGQEVWRKTLGAVSGGGPVIGADGRLYPSGAHTVLSPAGDSVGAISRGGHGTTLGANGVVYTAAGDSLFSFDRTGARRFAVRIPGQTDPFPLPFPSGGAVVGPDGTVYVRAAAGVVAIRDTVGPATDAPWPTMQGGARRAGRRTTP